MSSSPRYPSRREFLAASAALALPAAAARKPNIVYIMADDMGMYDAGCYGQKKIHTPNIDRLAAAGMQFSQTYCGATVCAPSRCCLMTGFHTGHGRVRANSSTRDGSRVSLRKEDVTVAQVLKQAGYATGIFGKWGIGEGGTDGMPERHGFDEWLGFLNQDHAVDYFTDYMWHNGQKQTLKGNLNGAKGEYAQEVFTREAIRFIDGHREQPFFLYLPYTTPHKDYMIPSDAPYSKEPWPEDARKYAAMVTSLDADVGRVLDALRKAGVENDTLVFFTSDNGAGFREGLELFHSTGPLRGAKGDVYEGGIRAPMIARWPGKIRPGSHSRQVWAFWDFLPTAAEIAGAATPAGLDGISIAPTLMGRKQTAQHDFLYWEAFKDGFQQAARMGDWKGVRNSLGGPLEVYNLTEDIGESRDVAAARPDIAGKLEAYLQTARTEAEDYPTTPRKKKKKKS